ncbi:MAG: hypothetical protein J6M05_05740 [Cardiobacteriaceae bacterium]|nr:hypothetical protein [Cardiobacteriaceae bacterium]
MPLFVFICKINPPFFNTADFLFFTIIARLANDKAWQFTYRNRHFERSEKSRCNRYSIRKKNIIICQTY